MCTFSVVCFRLHTPTGRCPTASVSYNGCSMQPDHLERRGSGLFISKASKLQKDTKQFGKTSSDHLEEGNRLSLSTMGTSCLCALTARGFCKAWEDSCWSTGGRCGCLLIAVDYQTQSLVVRKSSASFLANCTPLVILSIRRKDV